MWREGILFVVQLNVIFVCVFQYGLCFQSDEVFADSAKRSDVVL